jgi:hypothetical protein
MGSSMRSTILVLGIIACAGPQTRAPVAAKSAQVAQTRRFGFYSRLDFNLFDRLQQWAFDGERDGADCIDSLPGDERLGWERAVAYLNGLGRDGTARVLFRFRYEMVHPDLELPPRPGDLARGERPWAAAAPAYEHCYWTDDDRRNRAWTLRLVALLERAEEPIATRIAAAHHLEWGAEPIPVDVVKHVSWEGANTLSGPDHILISSSAAGFDGFGALEMLFHEASHTIVYPRSHGSVDALRRAAERAHRKVSDDLWHILLFYTAGFVTETVVEELWSSRYEQFLFSQGVLLRAWPGWREPLERYWAPYLRGEMSLDAAADGLIAASGAESMQGLQR